MESVAPSQSGMPPPAVQPSSPAPFASTTAASAPGSQSTDGTLTTSQRTAAWMARMFGSPDSAHQPVRIKAWNDGGYHVVKFDDYDFQCRLTFDDAGRPSVFEKCGSVPAQTTFAVTTSPSKIRVMCTTKDRKEICSGSYTFNQAGSRSTEMLLVYRKMADTEPD